MADDKVYKPEKLEKEYPSHEVINVFGDANKSTNQSSGGKDIQRPSTAVDRKFPEVYIARETISQSLNTQQKRILGNFTFGQVGALQIGEYKDNESGDIKISPAGIVARNQNGETTFALDGQTGDATFKGTISAGSFIAGVTQVGSPNVVIDGANARIIINDGTHDRILIGYHENGF